MTEALQVPAADPRRLATRAGEFARIASLLADEASAMALLHSGPGHTADVAVRAAQQAREAAETLREMAEAGVDFESAVRAATWALSAAAVAMAQAKLNTRLSGV